MGTILRALLVSQGSGRIECSTGAHAFCDQPSEHAIVSVRYLCRPFALSGVLPPNMRSEQKANLIDYRLEPHDGSGVRSRISLAGTIIMDEGRKRVLLIAASILAARKLAQYDGGKRVPATVAAISDAVRWAEEIMRAIDERFSVGQR